MHVACAIIENNGQVLMAQRPPGKSLALKWEFPGGKLEDGESAAVALEREILEELGIEVEVLVAPHPGAPRLPHLQHHPDSFHMRAEGRRS